MPLLYICHPGKDRTRTAFNSNWNIFTHSRTRVAAISASEWSYVAGGATTEGHLEGGPHQCPTHSHLLLIMFPSLSMFHLVSLQLLLCFSDTLSLSLSFSALSCHNSVSRDVLDLVNNRLTSVELMVRLLPCSLASYNVTLACHLPRRAGNSCQLKTHSSWQAGSQVSDLRSLRSLFGMAGYSFGMMLSNFLISRLSWESVSLVNLKYEARSIARSVSSFWTWVRKMWRGGQRETSNFFWSKCVRIKLSKGAPLSVWLLWHFGPCLLWLQQLRGWRVGDLRMWVSNRVKLYSKNSLMVLLTFAAHCNMMLGYRLCNVDDG